MEGKNLLDKHKILLESLKGVNVRVAKKVGVSRNWVSRVMNGHENGYKADLIKQAALEEFYSITDQLVALREAA